MGSEWENFKQLDMPEEAHKQTLEYQESSLTETLYKVSKRSPFLVAGILGFTAICGIGAYKWKMRKIPTALFLVQLRVAAQGTALGCLTMGMLYHLYTDLTSPKNK